MGVLHCPFCDARSNFEVKPLGVKSRVEGDFQDQAAVCSNTDCQRVIGVQVHRSDMATIGDWWPKHVGGKDFPDVPEQIGSTADEAHRCLSINAARGAIALARAVVEATAKEHEITTGSLFQKIETMEQQGIISKHMRDAADEIRFAGNGVAHGDLVDDDPSPEDACDVLDLMDSILMRVYQEPKQVERVRERRKSRNG